MGCDVAAGWVGVVGVGGGARGISFPTWTVAPRPRASVQRLAIDASGRPGGGCRGQPDLGSRDGAESACRSQPSRAGSRSRQGELAALIAVLLLAAVLVSLPPLA